MTAVRGELESVIRRQLTKVVLSADLPGRALTAALNEATTAILIYADAYATAQATLAIKHGR